MDNLFDAIELQDLAKGYVVIKENNEVIIEGFFSLFSSHFAFKVIFSLIGKEKSYFS